MADGRTVSEIMSHPVVTATAGETVAAAADRMRAQSVGSVIVVDGERAAGILTERDLVRLSADGAGSDRRDRRRVDDTGSGLRRSRPARDRRLRQPRASTATGTSPSSTVVASSASCRCATSCGSRRSSRPSHSHTRCPAGSKGWWSPRRPSATCAASRASTTTASTTRRSWPRRAASRTCGTSCSRASCPRPRSGPPSSTRCARCATSPAPYARRSRTWRGSRRTRRPSTSCARRSRCSARALGYRPSLDVPATELRAQGLRVCAVVPTLLTALHRLQRGLEVIDPRPDLAYASNYLYMMNGEVPPADHARAVEQYLISTVDHGFNASTFTARVITSTGADLAAAIVGAIGALSGPLHGGAPSRGARHARRHRYHRQRRPVDP